MDSQQRHSRSAERVEQAQPSTIVEQQTVMTSPEAKPAGRPQSSMRRWSLRLAAPLILACLTIFATHRYLSSQESRQGAQDAPVLVERLVAGEDLRSGSVIALEHLAVRELPQSWVGADSFGADEIDHLIGLQLTSDVLMGLPLTRAVLRRPMPNEFLGKLEPNRRAVTLTVSRSSGAEGGLQAEEMIDLYVTFEHKGQRITSLLLRRVRILQIAQAGMEMVGAGLETVTVDVAQHDAAKLIAAQQGGVLTAVQVPVVSDPAGDDGAVHDTMGADQRADHLAGFAGIDTSFDQLQVPDIIYGDLNSAGVGATR